MSTVITNHFDKAAQLYRDGLSEEAVRELKRAVDEEPANVKCYVTLAALYESLHQFDKAIEVYKKAVQIDIDDPRTNLRLGLALMHMHRASDALTPLRMAWSNDQKNPRAANALARALDETGDYDTAQIMYEEALKLDPGLPDARFNLATLRFNAHKFESAITQFMTYIVKVGDNSRAHRNIGKALVQLGQLESAINSFHKAAKLDPSDATIYYNLGMVYYLQDNYKAAFDNYRHALSLDPSYIDCRYTLAKDLRSKGNITEAMTEFQTVLQLRPDHYRALNGLANCYLAQHDAKSAASLLRQAIAISPDFALAHYNLGIALRTLGFNEESLEHFKEAARLDPCDELAHKAAGMTVSPYSARPSHLISGRLSYRLSSAQNSM